MTAAKNESTPPIDVKVTEYKGDTSELFKRNRPRTPSPMEDAVKEALTSGKALIAHVTEGADVETICKWLAKAGRDLKVTVRKSIEYVDDEARSVRFDASERKPREAKADANK